MKQPREQAAPPRIACSQCGGTGQVELNGAFADTLALLRKQTKERTGVEMAALAGIKPTAMNNRLVWLEQHGLAVGRRYGPARYWRAV